MARRAKQSLSPAQKAQRKDAKAAQEAQAKASNALARLPADVERRNELWHQFDALKAQSQGINGEVSQHKKRMNTVFGITKAAMSIRNTLINCPDGDYEATVEQVILFMRDFNRPFQLSMFKSEPGKGVDEDEGAVFDGTRAGERHSAERLDDPGRARKVPEPAAIPNGPTPVVSLEEAERLFRERHNAAAIAAQKAQDAQEFEGTVTWYEGTPSPTANDAEPASAGQDGGNEGAPRSPSDIPKRRGRPPMTEEQKAAAKAERLAAKGKPAPAKEVRAKADKYVAEQEERMNGHGVLPPPAPDEDEPLAAQAEDDEADGRYQILS